jgi:hypothetical protein
VLGPRQIQGIEVDGLLSKERIRNAITAWAASQLREGMPFFLYLIGRGLEDGRIALTPEVSESDSSTYLTGSDLDLWLSELEIGGDVGEVTVMVDSSYSGSFAEELSRSGRLVIASTDDVNPARMGNASFTGIFSRYVGSYSVSLSEALQKTSDSMFWGQLPWFEADGDGIVNGETDYMMIEDRFMLVDAVPSLSHIPEIVATSESLNLGVGEWSASFWIEVSGPEIDNAWFEVIPPDFVMKDEKWDIPPVEMTFAPDTGVYVGEYNEFSNPGTYKIAFYAEDSKDEISIPVWIYVQVDEETKPWDVNRDNIVNILDLVMVGKNFGSSADIGDVNGDGTVDTLDLLVVEEHYGEGTGDSPFGPPRDKHQIIYNEVDGKLHLSEPLWALVVSGRVLGSGAWLALPLDNERSVLVGLGEPFHVVNAGIDPIWGLTTDEKFVLLNKGRRPDRTRILPNYPNPFNPETWIPFEISRDSRVELRIYDVKGRHVRTLNLGHRIAGAYAGKDTAVHWNGRNEQGEEVGSGVYFYVLHAGKDIEVGRMTVLR